MKERGPIFYDAERVRWRRTRRAMEISGVLLTLLLAYFFVTIAISVELPAGLLPDTKPGYHPLRIKKKVTPVREGRRRRVANIGSVPASYEPVRAAFFVSWDPNSIASLKKNNIPDPVFYFCAAFLFVVLAVGVAVLCWACAANAHSVSVIAKAMTRFIFLLLMK